jgi:hypothetical protein
VRTEKQIGSARELKRIVRHPASAEAFVTRDLGAQMRWVSAVDDEGRPGRSAGRWRLCFIEYVQGVIFLVGERIGLRLYLRKDEGRLYLTYEKWGSWTRERIILP